MRKLLLSAFVLASSAQAKIWLDHEDHPIPFVDITVVLPVGFESARAEEAGAGALLSDILENGTAKRSRQEFLDKLAAYGANYSFNVSNQFSYWKLSFPVVPGHPAAAGLGEILSENWSEPRFNEETLKVAKVKLEAMLKGGLDNDMALGITTARRWVNKNEFGGFPVFVEDVAGLKLPTVKSVFARDFQRAPNVWVGVVGPASALADVKSILARVFSRQGEIDVGKHLEKLQVAKPADMSHAKPSKLVLLLDKPGRNQTVTSVIGILPRAQRESDELGFLFGNHILVDSGLGSYFGEEIRNKRGLAYAVSAVNPNYLGMPVLGLSTNPVRPKTEEAFRVISELLANAYESGRIFQDIPGETWDRQWNSFRYGRILERSTPMGRVAERLAVATGLLSPSLYAKPVEEWSVKRSEVQELMSRNWKDSVIVLSVVGEPKELSPLVQKYFPEYRPRVIPYRESVSAKAYR